MVVMDMQDYINKSNEILTQSAYRAIPWDPTNKIKAKLITIPKKVKSQTRLDSNTYKAMYPTGCSAPKFYWFPKIHKPDMPLRPIVSQQWLKYLPKYLNHWLISPPITSTVPKTLLNRSTR